jgi:hypothetical protein
MQVHDEARFQLKRVRKKLQKLESHSIQDENINEILLTVEILNEIKEILKTIIRKKVKPIIQLNLKGKVVREFSSVNEAGNLTGLNKTSISSALTRKRIYKNYKWEYKK